jgi:hypothetical protein
MEAGKREISIPEKVRTDDPARDGMAKEFSIAGRAPALPAIE